MRRVADRQARWKLAHRATTAVDDIDDRSTISNVMHRERKITLKKIKNTDRHCATMIEIATFAAIAVKLTQMLCTHRNATVGSCPKQSQLLNVCYWQRYDVILVTSTLTSDAQSTGR
jgi:hypothetical protein